MSRDGEIYYRLPDGTALYRAEIDECFMHVLVDEPWRIEKDRADDTSFQLDLFERMEFHDAPIKRVPGYGITVENGHAWVITDVWASFLHSELTLNYAGRFKHKFSGPWLQKGLRLERPLVISPHLHFQALYTEHEDYVDTVSVVLRGFFTRGSTSW